MVLYMSVLLCTSVHSFPYFSTPTCSAQFCPEILPSTSFELILHSAYLYQKEKKPNSAFFRVSKTLIDLISDVNVSACIQFHLNWKNQVFNNLGIEKYTKLNGKLFRCNKTRFFREICSEIKTNKKLTYGRLIFWNRVSN